MKKVVIFLFILSLVSLFANSIITKKKIEEWSEQCCKEYAKTFVNVEKNRKMIKDGQNSIKEDFTKWFEGYNDLKNNKNVEMWKFQAPMIQDSIKVKCPETAKNLPDLVK